MSATTTIVFNTDQGSNTFTDGNGVIYTSTQTGTYTIFTNSSVTTIGSNAFLDNTQLISVDIGNIVTLIDGSAFQSCSLLATVTFQATSTLATIGQNAFQSTVITSIEIPNSVTLIDVGAFQSCSLLATVTFQATSTLATIGQNAFQSTVITSIEIPNSVTLIDVGAFYNCTSLATVTFQATSTLATINDGAFDTTIIDSIIIPSSVTTLGNNVFTNNSAITSVTNSSPTLTIGSGLFDDTFNSSSHNFYSNSSSNPMYSYIQTYYPDVILSPPSCFNEGSLILTKNGYQAIENIKVGDEILTLNQTYKKVTHIVNQPFEASDLKITNYMCKYKCDNFPDLLVTGGHSLMVDELNDVMKEFSKEHTYFNVNAGDKYKLLAGLDDRCEKIVDGVYNIYHLVLENDGDLDLWYWIYSNGMITETMSEKYYNYANTKRYQIA